MSIEKPTPEEIKAKDKMIRTEKRKLKALLQDLDEDKKKAAEGLIDECAFMRATLKQYRVCINEQGGIDEMQQGEYSILREHPAVKSYLSMVPKYSVVCGQLFAMLPAKAIMPELDDFDEFRKANERKA